MWVFIAITGLPIVWHVLSSLNVLLSIKRTVEPGALDLPRQIKEFNQAAEPFGGTVYFTE